MVYSKRRVTIFDVSTWRDFDASDSAHFIVASLHVGTYCLFNVNDKIQFRAEAAILGLMRSPKPTGEVLWIEPVIHVSRAFPFSAFIFSFLRSKRSWNPTPPGAETAIRVNSTHPNTVRSELDMGPFSLTQSNPIHELMDPIQSIKSNYVPLTIPMLTYF